MQCFVHPNLAASVVCKKCGKAMCVDCSAFANHSGLCPNCRKESVEDGLRKLNGIKKVNIWMVLILSIFILAGTGAVYFLEVLKNPLVFTACAAVPVLIVYLVLKLKKLRTAEQGLNANLAQIKQTLGKALPQHGILNPLNVYQDLDACATPAKPENWAQLAFIEPVPEEIPIYSAGTSGDALPDHDKDVMAAEADESEPPATSAIIKTAPPKGVPDILELQIAAGNLIAEDEFFDGQITFREVIEELIEAFNRPMEEYADRPRPHRTAPPRPRPVMQKSGAARPPRPVPKPAEAMPQNTPHKPVVKPDVKPEAAHPPKAEAKPNPSVAISPPPRPRPLFSDEEKKLEKERAEMRKQLLELREQINELYKKNR